MKRRIKKWAAALMCGVMVMGYVFTTQAAGHTCIEFKAGMYRESTRPYNDKSHMVYYKVIYKCQICEVVKRIEPENIEELHNRDSFRDLGHQGKHDHRYELYCSACQSSSQIITITTCDVETTGYHTTPW